ncbi:MAG: hypothetical protein ACFUZC_03510 [Chthoniobacteraceae bacterium]
MLQTSDQKKVFVDLLGGPITEWKSHSLIEQWTQRTDLPFVQGVVILTEMAREGTVALTGQTVKLASPNQEEVR